MAQGDYEQGARIGLGIKMAHEAALRFAEDGTQYAQILGELVEPTIELVVSTQARHLVQEAFPGATVEPPAQPNLGPPAYQGGPPVATQMPLPQYAGGPAYQGGPPVATQMPLPQYAGGAPVYPQPGTNVQQHLAQNQPQAPQSPWPQQQYQPGPAPMPMPPSDDEALWRLLFSDWSGWYDNRATKTGNQPDFKKKPGGRDAPALWLNRAPAWVKQQFGIA
jgi:hypothetical protein